MKFSARIRLAAIGFVAYCFVTYASAQTPPNATPDKEKPPERLIYLPFKSLKSVFEKPDGSVLVPYADYQKLWDKAFGDGTRKPDSPTVGAAIASANYSAKVEKDVVQITAFYVVQAIEKGWVEIPVKFGDAAIGKLTSDSGKVLLRGTGSGAYVLMLPSLGEHKVTLELTAGVRTTPEGKSFDLSLPAVGIANLELLVPEVDQTFELKPKRGTQTIEASAGGTKLSASLGSVDSLSVRWHARVGSKPELELLASVTNQTLVTIEDGLVHTDASLTYDVLRGQIEKLKLVVPKEHRILDVTSDAKVKDWKVTEEDNRQIVNVEMFGRSDGKVTIDVHTERTLPTDAIDVTGLEGATAYGIHSLDVVREMGTVAVKSGADITLSVEDQRGLTRIDESEIGPKLKKPGALYYKYYSPNVRLRLLSKPVEPRLTVDHQSQLVFREDQLRLRSNLTYAVDRAGVFELKFKIPANLTVENVICDRMKQFDVSPDKSTLTIGLKEKALGSVSVTIVSTRTLDPAAEKTDQSLPILEPLNIELENGKVQVYAPDSIEVISDAERLNSVQPDPASQAEPIPNVRLVSSWLYNHRPIDIPVRTVRKPTRLTAIVGTKAEVKQALVRVTTNLNYQIEYAGIDTFRFAVPEAVAEKLEIRSTATGAAPTIKQKSKADTAIEGWVTWTVIMQREILGLQSFEIIYDLVPTKGTDVNEETATIEALRVLDPYDKTAGPVGRRATTISRTIGEITVVKDRALSVSAVATGGDAEPIDVRELQYLSQDGIVAFRYFKPPVSVELKSRKFDIQEVVETVVSKSLVEIVLDRTGNATNRCRYVLKSSERQRLRIDLPANVEVLGVMVDKKTTALEKSGAAGEKGWDSYFVSVARTKPSDEPFTLSVIFRHLLNPPPFQNAGGSISPRLPIVGGAGSNSIAVQQLYVKIWVPNDYALVGTPKNFSAQTRTPFRERLFGTQSSLIGERNLDEWIGHDTGGVFEFPTEGNMFQYMNLGGSKQINIGYWQVSFYSWIVGGSIVLISLILRRTSWENKLTVVIVGLFATCAYALKDSDLILSGLNVAIYGLIAAFGIWLIHAFTKAKAKMATAGAPVAATDLPTTDSSSN